MTTEAAVRKAFEGAGAKGTVEDFNDIHRVIAVMSGKGGVGKSLVSGLLAVTFQREGYQVGILDADIAGPSIPKMLFSNGAGLSLSMMGPLPPQSETGIRVTSMSLLPEQEYAATVWRGPLISGAIRQFWGDILWGELDYLIVDLPPGTSDAALTVMQSLPISGIVLVTSPQDLAGRVVRKAAHMARQMQVPILGLVENMGYVECPDTGKRHEVFGPSHAVETAQWIGVPLLGRLPIDPVIAMLCDVGCLEDYVTDVFAPIARDLDARTPQAQWRSLMQMHPGSESWQEKPATRRAERVSSRHGEVQRLPKEH